MIMTLFHNQFLFFSVDLMLLLCTIKPQNYKINFELSLPVWYLFNVLCLEILFLLGYYLLIDMKLILVTMNKKMGRQGV